MTPSPWNVVYARPDDDQARQVLADWLLDQGDRRGELIALQLRGGDPKSEASLIKKYGQSWAGPLAKIATKDLGWSRGFITTLKLKPKAAFVDDPALALVEELQCAPGCAAAYLRLPRLRALTWVDRASFAAMIAAPPPGLERLELRGSAMHSWKIKDAARNVEIRKAIPLLVKQIPGLRELGVVDLSDALLVLGHPGLQSVRALGGFNSDTFRLDGRREKGGWTLRISTDGTGPDLANYLGHFFHPYRSEGVKKVELVGVHARSLGRLRRKNVEFVVVK